MRLFPVEGNRQRLDGGAMYGNAPRAVWQGWSPPDDANRIELACRALLLQRDDGSNVLFEAGIGAFFEPKLKERFGVTQPEHVLLNSLAGLGVKPADIHHVVLSHLHFDHAGGLLSAHGDGPPRLVFPNATFHVGAEHWARAQHPHVRDRASFIPVLNQLLQSSGRLSLLKPDGPNPLAPLVTFHLSNGHTPGLMLAQINMASGPVVFAADLVPGVPWVHVPITMGYDRYPELLVDEKTALLGSLAASGGKLFFTHDPQVPCAAVSETGGRFSGRPVDVTGLA